MDNDVSYLEWYLVLATGNALLPFFKAQTLVCMLYCLKV